MTKIENNATSKNLLRGGQSIEETIQGFLDCAESVSVDATTKHSLGEFGHTSRTSEPVENAVFEYIADKL
ncbi:hypothetical protein F441_03115 [Phytophthora nicotianae CJ01A1]|uniref:Uncharacterized protein n=1 Tax=Phytophthora nicotianae CJ01A1 TaxID=1317063 RepID=W2XLR4_PHYNI|nr:hypothetical protein F441_03115 [Phytophthora nicotianae CJ01A1]